MQLGFVSKLRTDTWVFNYFDPDIKGLLIEILVFCVILLNDGESKQLHIHGRWDSSVI